jgi:hypothetical protein
MPLSGKSRRLKGQAAEREFFKELNRHLPENLRIQRELSQTRDGGADGESAGFIIEVKRQENLRFKPWLEQVRKASENRQALENPKASENRARSRKIPVVAYRQCREPWRCLVEVSSAELAAIMRCRQDIDHIVADQIAASDDMPDY